MLSRRTQADSSVRLGPLVATATPAVDAAVFDWVPALIAEAGLIEGDRTGVDSWTMEANAAYATSCNPTRRELSRYAEAPRPEEVKDSLPREGYPFFNDKNLKPSSVDEVI